MAAATFLHTGMRAPAPESRSHELETLIAALDKDDFNKSLFAQFNALHPKLGNTLEEVEDFKRFDRVLRLILSVLLLFFSYWSSSWILLAAGLFVFFEAVAGWCIIYQFLGKSSCHIKRK